MNVKGGETMVGSILKKLREAKGLTQQEAADKIGIKKRALMSYEAEERDISTSLLSKFADFYGVTADYLLSRDETAINPIQQLSDDETEKAMMEEYFQLPKPVRAQIMQMMVNSVRKSEERKRKANIVNTAMAARAEPKPLEPFTAEQDAQLLSSPILPDDL